MTAQTELDPQAAALLEQTAAIPPPHTVQELRDVMRMIIFLAGDAEPTLRVENRSVPGLAGGIPVRLYWPSEKPDLPILVYYHGGGFIAGDLDTADTPMRALANRSGRLIVSVEYRLAPEHPFPAAPDDCYAATAWVSEHAAELGGDASNLAVCGDSAGGNLAAVISQRAKRLGGPPIAQQILVYPATDAAARAASWEEFGHKNYILTNEGAKMMMDCYLPAGVDRKQSDASPLRAEDLSGLPPALVITAECDPLRDEGKAYAERLKAAGVPTTYTCYPGQVHGFFHMAGVLDGGKAAIEQVAEALR